MTEIGCGVEVRAIAALAFFELSAMDVAVRATAEGFGTLAGAVNVTELTVMLESVPQALPEQPLPERVQVTPLFPKSFCTDAVKGADVDTWMDALGGFTDTEIGGGGGLWEPVTPAQEVNHKKESAISAKLSARRDAQTTSGV